MAMNRKAGGQRSMGQVLILVAVLLGTLLLLTLIIGLALYLGRVLASMEEGIVSTLLGLGIFVATLGVVVLTYHLSLRPWIMHWGATQAEVLRDLQGDELSISERFRSTRAITIAAPAREVWRWLIQIGWQRGGFYSYNWLERLFGVDLRNAESINPEWQDLAKGDELWMAPHRYGKTARLVVSTLVPERTLVLDMHGRGAWSFHLEPIDDQESRLVARFQLEPVRLWAKLFLYLILEPVHFIMERGMLRGLKKRAERATMAARGSLPQSAKARSAP